MKSRSGLQNPSFFTMLIRVGKSLSVKIQHPENNARPSMAGTHQRSIPCQKKKHRKWALNLRQTTGDSHNFNEQHEHVFHKSSYHWAKPEIKHKDATGKLVCSALTPQYHYCVVCFVLTTVTLTHYYKVRWIYYKLRQVLQSAMIITNCDSTEVLCRSV